MKRSVLTLSLLALVACGSDEPMAPGPDAGGIPDLAGPPSDGGTADAGTPDSGGAAPVSIDVSSVFPAGTMVRDGYTGHSATVGPNGTVQFVPGAEGVVLVERADAPMDPAFTWDNATVYFVLLDRFENGSPANDNGHGRDFTGMPTTGTFHGGDLVGLTQRLDHIADLGANAIWITAPFEQIHGYVGGGGGGFPHFAYAGYWALDFTRLDENFGTEDELRTFVDAAHQRGLRVIFDVVMNHPGYATMPEIATYFPDALKRTDWASWRPGPGENWNSFNDLFIDFTHPSWANWWGQEYVRAGLPGYDGAGNDDLKMSLASLPDFKTEEFRAARALPPLLASKMNTGAIFREGFTVRQYLVEWLTNWVREYGIDGFRCDTAKHVEREAWRDLKTAGVAALAAWKQANPGKALDDAPFWMTGEVFPHGVAKDDYYTRGGFDSLINFDFKDVAAAASQDATRLEGIYSGYASAINVDPDFNVLTYISSHDTSLFFETTGRDMALQYDVGTALMLLPGAIQIFYGDETARPSVSGNGDSTAGTRSDMNWDAINAALLAHWQTLGRFRNRHPAIGAGEHRGISNDANGYVFSRVLSGANQDEVVIALTSMGR